MADLGKKRENVLKSTERYFSCEIDAPCTMNGQSTASAFI